MKIINKNFYNLYFNRQKPSLCPYKRPFSSNQELLSQDNLYVTVIIHIDKSIFDIIKKVIVNSINNNEKIKDKEEIIKLCNLKGFDYLEKLLEAKLIPYLELNVEKGINISRKNQQKKFFINY